MWVLFAKEEETNGRGGGIEEAYRVNVGNVHALSECESPKQLITCSGLLLLLYAYQFSSQDFSMLPLLVLNSW